MQRALVLLAEGFEEVEAVTPIDFLRRAGVETTVAGVGAREILGAHDIRITVDITVEESTGQYDAVVLPGGAHGARGIAADAASVELVRRALHDGKLVAAICASPGVVLGGHGLIGARRFTCYPGFESLVTGGTFVEERVVTDGNLITSRGPGTAAEFAEAIVSYLVGPEAALDLHRRTLQK